MIRFALAFVAVFVAAPARADVDIQELTSPGGFDAWLVESHEIPFVALELRFRGGASLDAPGKRGATNLMGALLEEGAGDLDSQAFNRRAEELAVSFSYSVSDDAVSVSARFLTENREEAIDLLRDSLINPRFDQDAIDRVRAQVESGIQSDAKDPNSIAQSKFRELVYGEHPYGTVQDGTLDSVAALKREDIVAAHQAAMTRDHLFVSAVGDINAEELGALLDELLAELPDATVALADEATLNLPGDVQVVDFPTPQSVVTFGQPGMDRNDDEFFAAFVLNHILGGGGFESRLMQEVREKRGLTYGIYTYLSDRDGAEIMMGSVASANDRVAEAIEVVKNEWARIRDEGVTEAELEDAKTYLTGAYPLRFDGNGTIANIAAGMQMSGRSTDYIANRNDRVNAVTLEDINRVAREFLDPDKLTFVVVGQPEGL